MIQFKEVQIGYKSVLIQMNELTLNAGNIYALIGSNGSGKTTLLNTIIGKTPLIKGSLFIETTNIKEFHKTDLAKKIAYVEAKFDGIEYLTVKDYISLGRTPHTDALGRLRSDDIEHIENAIKTMCLEDYVDRFTTELSDGERQLTAIARALAQDTAIIILDEPTAFLDYGNRKRLIKTLSYIASRLNKCILFSTHDIDLCLEERLAMLIVDQEAKQLQEYTSITKSEILKIGFNYSLIENR